MSVSNLGRLNVYENKPDEDPRYNPKDGLKDDYKAGSKYGCLFCRSGSEERIIRDLKNSHPTLTCISPKRVRVRRQGEKETVTLFPGYIFFKTPSTVATVAPDTTVAAVDFRSIIQKSDVYRLLQYIDGKWELCGSDLRIAMFLFEMGGVLDLSKGRFEGDTLRFISGPLKEYEDYITKIDKRAKTAQVTIEFHGERIIMWLGFEIEETLKGQ